MADQGIVTRTFAGVLRERRTPAAAIAFTTVVAVILISTGDLSTLADTTVLLLLFVFTMVNIAVLVLRREEVEHDHFHAPSIFPVLGALVSVALIVDTALDDLSTFARAAGLVALGVVLYFVNRAADGSVGSRHGPTD
jgi:APA family basic amino acid/polyamine antiporter